VAVTVVPAVTRMVPRASGGPSHHLRLISALLGTVHRVREGGGHVLRGGYRVDSPRRLTARGTPHGVARLRERTLLLEQPALSAEKFVDWHSVSSPMYRTPTPSMILAVLSVWREVSRSVILDTTGAQESIAGKGEWPGILDGGRRGRLRAPTGAIILG
jgi:hypothetical protein